MPLPLFAMSIGRPSNFRAAPPISRLSVTTPVPVCRSAPAYRPRRRYQTRLHSHPYVEALTVLEGRGEAWLEGEDGIVCLEPGVSIALPANRVLAFRVVGDRPLVTYGIHASDIRIVNYLEPPPAGS